jgi:transglutaminase-like putative cysteine protease
MRLIIQHKTLYRYDDAPKNLIQVLRLWPRSDAHQRVVEWRVIAPGKLTAFTDAYGNMSYIHVMATPKTEMALLVLGTVDTQALTSGALGVDVGDQGVPPIAYLVPTPLTQSFPKLDELARHALPDGLRTEWDALALSKVICQAMPYTAGSTDVTSTAQHAFEGARGVCQDHAHVMIAACRSLGVAARYVSGYVEPSNSRAAASHAWVDIWLANRWVSVDVTNEVFASEYHCRLAVGRDYLDACPVRGMREGGFVEHLEVTVAVQTVQQ